CSSDLDLVEQGGYAAQIEGFLHEPLPGKSETFKMLTRTRRKPGIQVRDAGRTFDQPQVPVGFERTHLGDTQEWWLPGITPRKPAQDFGNRGELPAWLSGSAGRKSGV